MNVDSIRDGLVIDHIAAGKGMLLYRLLGLEELSCPVALIANVQSKKMGRKDIIKIDAPIDINLQIIGYADPHATVSIIRNGMIAEKAHIELPLELKGVLKCKNPRCITSVEQDLPHIFRLSDRARREYRCFYCEAKAAD